jgi:hypothetical protein
LSYSESEEDDIVFGSVISGRTTTDLERVVGPSFTAVPIRIRNVASASVADVLGNLVQKSISSLAHPYPPVSVLTGPKGIIYDTTLTLQKFAQGDPQTRIWEQVDHPPMATEVGFNHCDS